MSNFIKQFKSFDNIKKLNIIGCIILIIVMLCMLTSSVVTSQMLSQKSVDNRKEISSLKYKLNKMDEQKVVDEDDVANTLISCKAKGDFIAKYQNKYKSAEGQKEITSIADKLVGYFGEDEDGQSSWFSQAGTWKFKTPYKFSTTVIPVLWVCTDGSRDGVFAYATASFDSSTNKFKNLKRVVTKQGIKQTEVAVE